MTFPELGVKRHVMSYMVAWVIMVVGLISYFRIGIDLYPEVDFPFVAVVTSYPGADSEIVDNTITGVLLEYLNGIPGIDSVTARSYPGYSSISLLFELDKDVNIAFNEVQAKVNQALAFLPSGVDSPQVIKSSSNEDPFLRLVLSGDADIQQLTIYAEEFIKPKLETISGVSEIALEGAREVFIRVELDLYKLASLGLTIDDITSSIGVSHVQYPGGYLVGGARQILLNIDFEAHSIDDLGDIIIKKNQDSLIRLKDVANISQGLDNLNVIAEYNSKPAIGLSVKKIAGYNAFSIEAEVMSKLNSDISVLLPYDYDLSISSNELDYIRNVVSVLAEHLYLGTLLTALVVFLFLRSLTSTLIIALAIPVSLLGAVSVIYFFGYTFNALTLLGMLLLIGVVVDDAIIVLENVYRKMEGGLDRVQAAIAGSNQIMFAVLAATLSLVSIFGPVIFMGGIVGRFFQSFAVVVTFGVIFSYIVAIYVTPMLCSRFLRRSNKGKSKIADSLGNFFRIIEYGYKILLRVCLNHRIIVLIISLAVFISGMSILSLIKVEFFPDEDRSEFSVGVRTPRGSSVHYTIDKMREVENLLKQHTEINRIFTSVGSGSGQRGSFSIGMIPMDERDISQAELMDKVREEIREIPGISASIRNVGGVGGGNRLEFNFTGRNIYELYDRATILKDRLSAHPELYDIDMSLYQVPRITFDIDKDKASLTNTSPRQIAQALGVSVGGINVAWFNERGSNKRYRIRLKLPEYELSTKDQLSSIYFSNNDGRMLRLDGLVQTLEGMAFASIDRSSLMYSVSFTSNTNLENSVALAFVGEQARDLLTDGYNIELQGSSKMLAETVSNILFAFGLAVVLLYMVLASQFNSFAQPFVLLTSVPLAVIGAFFALYITNFSLNIFSMIGLVLLVGLVAKNAILLIDFTNELRAQGKNIRDSLMEACPIRLRPILMTSLTVILTMLTAALSDAEGSASNASLAIAVIGGMISSTMLTLVVVPVLYSLLEGAMEYFNNKRKKLSVKDV